VEPLILPGGYGFRRPRPGELTERGDITNLLTVYETPRRRGARRYVISADVADGIGLDDSVINVTRCGTIEEPAEQVAEFVSNEILPVQLAYTIQTLGQWYLDEDGYEAMVAIECNNHGLSTQDTLQLHLGYTHFYIWEYLDARDTDSRYSRRIGWQTNVRTRPILLSKFYDALCTWDPITEQSDYIIHSAILLDQLKDFTTDGALWEAAAARGAKDDCIMAAAIANYVAFRMQAGETEPLEERRRRRHQQRAHNEAAAEGQKLATPDWRNTPATADEADRLGVNVGLDPEIDEILYDPRRTDDVAW